MAALREILTEPSVRRRVVDDAARLVEDEVRSKSGMSGLAIKAGFKAFKKVKPGALQMAVDGLLDEFSDAIDPYYQDHVESGRGGSCGSTLNPRASDVANALLAITDRRAKRFEHKLIKKTYEKLRPTGVKNTAEAVPGISRLIDKYTRD